MLLCNVALSQHQADDQVEVAAVLSRWRLVVLHEGRSGARLKVDIGLPSARSAGAALREVTSSTPGTTAWRALRQARFCRGAAS